jgi:hypothetical protein
MTRDWRKEKEEADALARLAEVRAIPAFRGPRNLGHTVLKSLKPILKETAPASTSLASRWPEIVGERLARLTTLIRISRGKTGGVLHLRAASAAAPVIQHAREHILERVNLAAGTKMPIREIRIVQTAAPADVSAPRPRSLSPAEREALIRSLALVQTQAVRSALEELGKAVMTRRDKG